MISWCLIWVISCQTAGRLLSQFQNKSATDHLLNVCARSPLHATETASLANIQIVIECNTAGCMVAPVSEASLTVHLRLSSSSLTINPLFNTRLDEEDLSVWAIRPVILFPFFSPCPENAENWARSARLQPLVATAHIMLLVHLNCCMQRVGNCCGSRIAKCLKKIERFERNGLMR